ncbi:MAG: hypothetical protein R2827_05470 [Bdellovibrionales bacterium]
MKIILNESEQNNWKLIHANALEVSAQLAVNENDWAEAQQLLNTAKSFLKGQQNSSSLFIQKWLAIVQMFNGNNKVNSTLKLQGVREQAIKNRHWETVRECDLYIAKYLNDFNLLNKVYLGTPYREYRKSMLESFQKNKNPKENFCWNPSLIID